jgi:hypothetical protein
VAFAILSEPLFFNHKKPTREGLPPDGVSSSTNWSLSDRTYCHFRFGRCDAISIPPPQGVGYFKLELMSENKYVQFSNKDHDITGGPKRGLYLIDLSVSLLNEYRSNN